MRRRGLAAIAFLATGLYGQAPPPPIISSISPSSVIAGSPAFTLTVTGTGFQRVVVGSGYLSTSQVRWNGVALATGYLSTTERVVTIDASLVASAGTATVDVVNPGPVLSNSVVFTIVAPLGITTTSPLASGVVGGPYYQTLLATGGTLPLTWSVVLGAPPPGLTLNSVTGVISGTPAATGSYSFTVQVTDSKGSFVTRPFTLGIAQSGSYQGPDGRVGVPYPTVTLSAQGGTPPWTWAITLGGLPPGLALNSTTGQISGTPTTVGEFHFWAVWTDSLQQTGYPTEFIIRILAAAPTITTTSPLNTMTVGVAFSQTLAATGGTLPYTSWSIVGGALPAGLSLNGLTGAITGTPTVAGSGSVQVTVIDSSSTSASKVLDWTVNPAVLTITTNSPLSNATVGVSYSQSFAVTGGISPYTWSFTGTLPPGLTLSAAGVLSGTPTQSGAFTFTVRVDASDSFATKTFSVTVNPATLTITTASPLPNATAGTAYPQQTFAATGGIAPYTWSFTGTLPPGLTLSAAGVLSGTPAQGGAFTFTVRVDASGSSTTKAFSLTVTVPSAPTLSITPLTDPMSPALQSTIDVQISAAYPLTITGTVSLTFVPNAVNAADDPAIQFSTGGRTLNFTIPAGQTSASWPASHAIQTGTVAGQINLTLGSITAGGQNITPTPAPVRSVTIARAAPKINTVQVVKVTGGFNILVTGYSTPRQVTQAVFTFTPAAGADLQTTQVAPTVDSTFTTWYTGNSSPQYGSSFLYTQPFTVQGSVSDIVSVSVTLSNATGTSTAVSASF